MKTVTLSTAALAATIFVASGTAVAQVQPQYPQMQAQPVATQASVINLDNRIVSLERQLADMLRAEEENSRRITQLETTLQQERETSSARIAALEARLAAGAPATAVSANVEPTADKPPVMAAASVSKPKPTPAIASTDSDPAEEAYDAGYQLWRTGKYDAAIGALRAFSSSYPNHRRTSWANNLAGRAMLDKGEPRAAAEVLLANYRGNPKGERAADSLFYLGQSLMKLDQPAQACKAYSELEAVYGSTMRADLQKLLPEAKTQAKCRG